MAKRKQQYMVNIDVGLTFDGKFQPLGSYIEATRDAVVDLVQKGHLVEQSPLPFVEPVEPVEEPVGTPDED